MLTTVVTTMGTKPVLIAPAMNTAMLENPITKDNIRKLTGYGYHFIEPREALLACGDLGKDALFDLKCGDYRIRPDATMGYEACVNAFFRSRLKAEV